MHSTTVGMDLPTVDTPGDSALPGATPIQIADLSECCTDPKLGQQIYDFIAELYPICRSITEEGVRQTLSAIERLIVLEKHEVPTGTAVLDWTVPKEWNIRDAYVANARGERVIDFRKSCLHVVGYSVPVKGRFPLSELKKHVFTIPAHPDWIPFRYSYYDEDWGFCMAHNEFVKLEDGDYEVVIDSSLENGSLTYGECYLAGRTTDELVVCVHIDRPAMCNDNLSGVAVQPFSRSCWQVFKIVASRTALSLFPLRSDR